MFVVSLLGKIESATTKATCLVFPCVALKITCLIGSVLNHNAKIQAPYFGSFFCSKFWRSRRGFCSSSIDFSLSQIRKDAPNVSVGSSDDLCTVASLLLKRYNTTCMSCWFSGSRTESFLHIYSLWFFWLKIIKRGKTCLTSRHKTTYMQRPFIFSKDE
jgi:hypothetical protein